MINTVQQALEDVYVALGGQEDIDRLTVSQVLAKIYNVLGGTGDHGQETVPQLIDLIATVATGGGGGGDSDLSLAILTIINNNANEHEIELAGAIAFEEDELGEGAPACISCEHVIFAEETVLKAVLYKGSAFLGLFYGDDMEYTISGDMQETDENVFLLTGNATITFTTKK